MVMTFKRAQQLSVYKGAEDTATYEGERMKLSGEITKAIEAGDSRKVVILCRKFVDAFPAKLVPIERAVRDCFLEKLREYKKDLKSHCPVCHGEMKDTCCPDDIIRPFCAACGKTYTPLGYDCEDDYALKWHAKLWDGGSEPSEVIEVL